MILTLALLLISGLGHNAVADTGQEKSSKKMQKVAAYLATIGINNPKIIAFTSTIGERIEEDKQLRLTEEHFDTGRLVLHYKMRPKLSTRQMQLKFQPYESHSEFTATTNSLMWNYKYNF